MRRAWSQCFEEAGGTWKEWSELVLYWPPVLYLRANRIWADSRFLPLEESAPGGLGLPGNIAYEKWFRMEDPWGVAVPELTASLPLPEDPWDRLLLWRVWARVAGEPVPDVV
jgi:hypothetical protein